MEDEKKALVLETWLHAIKYGKMMITAMDNKPNIEEFNCDTMAMMFKSLCEIAYGVQKAYDVQLSDELKKQIEEEFEKVVIQIQKRTQNVVNKLMEKSSANSYNDCHFIKNWSTLGATCARLYRSYAKEKLYGIEVKQNICTRVHEDDDDDRYSGCAEE